MDRQRSRLPTNAPARPAAPPPDLSTRLWQKQRSLRATLQRRDTLIEAMRALQTDVDPAQIGEALIGCVAAWIPAPSWAVVIGDGSGQLALVASREVAPTAVRAVYGVAGWVTHHGQDFSAADLREDYRIAGHLEATVVGFVLACRGHTIGALIGFDHTASGREPRFVPAVREGLQVVIDTAALALDSGVRLQRAEALSVTDDLTGLFNSRFLTEALRRETKRARRSGRPVSVLFIDLDGFKTINDAYGHLLGSKALVEAAAVIRDCARETDVVARFGGDEFAVVLPESGSDGAILVARRVRERLAAHPFLASEHLEIHLTASVGIATMPDVAVSPDELVQAADKAMYRVKESGKNGIRLASE